MHTKDTIERFWSKVERSTDNGDCWEWRACRNRKGYGLFWESGVNRGAHRVAWEIASGPIPTGLHVLHRCDNPSCVNPSHLFLGTNLDNVRDRGAKGRTFRNPEGRTPRSKHSREEMVGINVPGVKLTEDQVREIRRRYTYKHPVHGQQALATEFGVDKKTIWFIVHRVTWRHI